MPFTFTRNRRSKSSSVVLSTVPICEIPALLTRISIRSFPWNKIFLTLPFRLRARLSAGGLDDKLQNLFTHLLDGLLPGNNFTRVNIDDVPHPLGQPGICR